MFSRFRRSIMLALVLSLILTFPAFAGGWAVITLDELPSNVVAGQPLTIGFTVLQHGQTPLTGLSPTITTNLYKEEEFTVTAGPEGKPGHYAATLTFPKEGDWQWSIQAFTMDQSMPLLSVAAPDTALVGHPEPKTFPVPWSASSMARISVVVLALGLLGALIGLSRRSRAAMLLTGLCLLLGIILLVAGRGMPSSVEAQAKSASNGMGESAPDVELGRRLFVAKGCLTCHYHSKAAGYAEYWTIEMGAPDLSNFSASREALFMRLKDPSSVKSDTKMPNLDLTKDEIEALIAFINAK